MRCKCKVLSVNGIPASDGSLVPLEICEAYLRSNECKEALENHTMLGAMSHAIRNVKAVFPEAGNALAATCGKDDALIRVVEGVPTPTHYVDKMYIEDGWLICEIQILDEAIMDDIAAQNIRRLKGLLKSGVHCGVSAVIVGFWSGEKNCDLCRKIVNFKGIDVTLSPSWKQAKVVSIEDDNEAQNKSSEKEFSEILTENYAPEDFKFSGIKAKTFSDVGSIYSGPKSSKIGGKFTTLKAKVFSADGVVCEIPEGEAVIEEQKEYTEPEETQKEFTQARVREELREMKLGLRMSFRRCLLSYRQAIKSMGGVDKIDPEDVKILKSMLNSEVLMILNQCTQAVIDGKQINTLLGTSSISKNLRVAGQALQLPLRMAHLEARRQGFVNKQRYQKLQAAYIDFTKAVTEEVFGPNSDKMNLGDENDENNGGEE